MTSESRARIAYGTLADGTAVDAYTLRSGALLATILTYGGTIAELHVPGRNGTTANVVLGYQNLARYTDLPKTFFGALIGRYGNRIAHGRFTLDGRTYELPKNNGENTLHGGPLGFDTVVWDVVDVREDALVLRHVSPNGAQGFPGTLDVRVTYTLGADSSLHVLYEATTDAPTVVNLTNHSYFNLAGESSGDVTRQIVSIAGSHVLPTDDAQIPTGERLAVAGTPFDFRTPRPIGDGLREPHPQIIAARGYDCCWILDREREGLLPVATAYDPESGRTMEVATTEIGVQFYTGNKLDGAKIGSSGRTYRQTSGFAMETQHFPNSPNEPSFPTTVLRPGEQYRSETAFRFSTV